MGNSLTSPCFPADRHADEAKTPAKVVFWSGPTRHVPAGQLAGELMFQFQDSILCHAGSFFIGKPVPALAIEDELVAGETYFILPADRLPGSTLTAASLALLSSTKDKPRTAATVVSGKCPFEYVKGGEGKAYIRVLPEFIEGMIGGGGDESAGGGGGKVSEEICSTPELKKHYEQLVGSRNRPWSPRLETITESKVRLSSPSRFLGSERRR